MEELRRWRRRVRAGVCTCDDFHVEGAELGLHLLRLGDHSPCPRLELLQEDGADNCLQAPFNQQHPGSNGMRMSSNGRDRRIGRSRREPKGTESRRMAIDGGKVTTILLFFEEDTF